MSGGWSSNDVVAEFRDLQAHAMGVDGSGQCALIAGKRNIALVDLNNPTENVKKVQRQSKWEISAVQWNPHASHHDVFAFACNQRADVCVWTDSSFRKQGSLKSHTRVVSDLDWSPKDCNLLATCSVDTFTYLWDTRDFRKPSISLPAVAGISQVKWNKMNSHLLATAHDGDVRIWDRRQVSSPLQYIAGHLSKIHGLDWDPTKDTHFATSSQDCSVKLWDYRNARQPEIRLPSSSPVWRARFTPFGRGMITVVVPQLRRGENSLFLWHLGNTREPVHTFVGHTDVVLAFQWRQPSETGDRQLVTWSKDQSLRLWKIDTQMQKLCGHEVPGESTTDDNPLAAMFIHPDHVLPVQGPEVNGDAKSVPAPPGGDPTKKPGATQNNHHTPPNSLPIPPLELKSPQQPGTLQQEFDLVNVSLQNVILTIEEMDTATRTFTFSAQSQNGKHVVQLTMRFPDSYPVNTPPEFKVGTVTSLHKGRQAKLLASLKETSQTHARHSRSCIEPCLRRLDNEMGAMASEERRSPENSDAPYPLQQTSVLEQPFIPSMYMGPSSLQDSSVPFPRTSGARFCGAGFLVCFTRKTISDNGGSNSSFSRRISSTSDLTPRAITALAAYSRAGLVRTPSAGRTKFLIARSPPSDGSVSISNFYHYREKKRQRAKRMKEGETRQKEATSPTKKQIKTGPVIIYNVDCLLPIQKLLAESYVIDSKDVPGMCRKNAAAAAAAGRKDLVQVWSLAELATAPTLRVGSNPDSGAPWAHHPFGRKLFKSLVRHYASIYDVQTLAMLSCAYGRKNSGGHHHHRTAAPPTPSGPGPVSRTSAKSPSDVAAGNANYNPYHTIHPSDTSLKGWNIKITKVRRSNSWSDIIEELKYGEESRDPADVERDVHEQNIRFIEPNQELLFDRFKKVYADILYRWDLLEKRAEVLKYVSIPAEPHTGVEFNNECQNCHKDARGPQCWHCKGHVFRCSICHVFVKGIANCCLACGHGGHATHMQEWFKTHEICPTGCGCNCLDNNPMSGH